MKIKWLFPLFIGLSLLLMGSLIGCTSAYTREDINTAYQEGYADGFAAGVLQSQIIEEPTKVIPPPEKEEEYPTGAISWDEAKYHIGDRATVCGPVVGASYRPDISGQPTWLNIGKDYPSSERFVVIIWGRNRGNFSQPPEDYYLGKTIYVTGLIEEYNEIPQIEAKAPDQIQDP